MILLQQSKYIQLFRLGGNKKKETKQLCCITGVLKEADM